MRKHFLRARARNKQGGYALLIVVCITALLLIATMSIGLRILTEGRRQKELDMIWRGKQYTRGIKLYYQKYGRFPTSMDDLTKPKVGNLRFMRQAYKDPMNKEDGSWRLIYVGPSGQLIGSLKPPQNPLQLPVAGAGGQNGVAGIGGANTSSGGFGFGNQQGATGGISPPGNTPSANATGAGTNASGTGATGAGTGTGAQGTDASGATNGTDSQAVPTGDTPTIMGGNIIGIGSKINQSSVIVYEKAKNYRLFEFIWDPSKDMGVVGSQGANIGTPAGAPAGTTPGTPGQNPGGAPSNPLSPPPAPPTTTTPNPSQP
jgi:hypothetical protein